MCKQRLHAHTATPQPPAQAPACSCVMSATAGGSADSWLLETDRKARRRSGRSASQSLGATLAERWKALCLRWGERRARGVAECKAEPHKLECALAAMHGCRDRRKRRTVHAAGSAAAVSSALFLRALTGRALANW